DHRDHPPQGHVHVDVAQVVVPGPAHGDDRGQGSRHGKFSSRHTRHLTTRGRRRPAPVRGRQGWTGPGGPLSRRSDCMIWKVVVLVKTGMSAAASTPVYLAIT